MKSFLVIALLLAGVFASPDYCSFFKNFGSSLSGDSCATPLNSGCLSAVDGLAQIEKLLAGDTTALMMLIADITSAFSSAKNSVTACQFMERIEFFAGNFMQLYTIVIQNFSALKADVECVLVSVNAMDLAKLGTCTGDILHILTTKA